MPTIILNLDFQLILCSFGNSPEGHHYFGGLRTDLEVQRESDVVRLDRGDLLGVTSGESENHVICFKVPSLFGGIMCIAVNEKESCSLFSLFGGGHNSIQNNHHLRIHFKSDTISHMALVFLVDIQMLLQTPNPHWIL